MGVFDGLKSLFKASSSRGFSPDSNYNPWGGSEKDMWSVAEDVDVNTLYTVIKKVPEVSGVIGALIEDVMTDFKFTGSKASVDRAEKFIKSTGFFKILSDALWDMFITGDAYILKLRIPPANLKSYAEKALSNLNVSKSVYNDLVQKAVDRVLRNNGVKSFQLLKASTVQIEFDKFGNVEKYVQRVGIEEKSFSPQDVVHLSLTNIGGHTYGFSPLQPLLKDLSNLIYAKNHAGKVFENGAIPPIIYVLKDVKSIDDRRYQKLIDELREMKKMRNSMRQIVATGDVDVKTINPFTTDMEFISIIRHFTSLVLLAYGVPPDRVPFVSDNMKFNPNFIRNYPKKINYMQKVIESQLYNEIFKDLMVDSVKFDRAYLIDELIEAQVGSTMAAYDAISVEEFRERVGMGRGLPEGKLPTHEKQKPTLGVDEMGRTREQRKPDHEDDGDESDNRMR